MACRKPRQRVKSGIDRQYNVYVKPFPCWAAVVALLLTAYMKVL